MTGDSNMRALERTLDWLRPLVQNWAWDYIIVWKLGDDPSRFIEWVGCCCIGANCDNVKEEKEEGAKGSSHLCRDCYRHHLIRTKACQALAHLPFSMSLYSGIHGEVVSSNQPRWISHASGIGSNALEESAGTRLLVPVACGVIELFNEKHMSEDDQIVELIMTQCNFFLQEEATNLARNAKRSLSELIYEDYLRNNSSTFYYRNVLHGQQNPTPGSQGNNTYPSLEGSSSISNPSNDCTSIDSMFISQDGPIKQSSTQSFGSKGAHGKQPILTSVRVKNLKNNRKVILRPDGEKYHSKNLITERNRRIRIKEGLFTLRSLVPKISKMDRAAIFTDAIDYIEELKREKKNLEDELMRIEGEEHGSNGKELKMLKLDEPHKSNKTSLPGNGDCQVPSCANHRRETQVRLDVIPLGKRNVLVKLVSEKKQGWFTKYMEGINSLGLAVVDANVCTLDSKVLAILTLEGSKKELEHKKLRESLLKFIH